MYGFPPIKLVNNKIGTSSNNTTKREYNKTINIKKILANNKNQFIKIDEEKDESIEVIKSI
jgi:methyl coenzyme M reductase beta subunit